MKKSKRILKKTIKKMYHHGDTCYICGLKVQPNNTQKYNGFTLDHVVAKIKGGRKLKTACRECNQRKAAMEIITVKKNTQIKIDGIPYLLANDTLIYGEQTSMDTAKNSKVVEGKKSFNVECKGE